MAYVRAKRIIKLVFDGDHEWAGLEVRTRSLSTGTLRKIIRLAGLTRLDLKNADPEELAQVAELFETFADALVSWSLQEQDEDGTAAAVPATLEGVDSQDVGFMLALIGEWMSKVGGVSQDLGKGSSSGVTFPEPSLPMVPRSPALASLTTPS